MFVSHFSSLCRSRNCHILDCVVLGCVVLDCVVLGIVVLDPVGVSLGDGGRKETGETGGNRGKETGVESEGDTGDREGPPSFLRSDIFLSLHPTKIPNNTA